MSSISPVVKENHPSPIIPKVFDKSYQNAHWVPDDLVQICMGNCFEKFTLSRRKHHCRSCFGIFCSSCMGDELQSPKLNKFCKFCLHSDSPVQPNEINHPLTGEFFNQMIQVGNFRSISKDFFTYTKKGSILDDFKISGTISNPIPIPNFFNKGHSAVYYKDSVYIYGGFNMDKNILSNTLIRFTPGDPTSDAPDSQFKTWQSLRFSPTLKAAHCLLGSIWIFLGGKTINDAKSANSLFFIDLEKPENGCIPIDLSFDELEDSNRFFYPVEGTITPINDSTILLIGGSAFATKHFFIFQFQFNSSTPNGIVRQIPCSRKLYTKRSCHLSVSFKDQSFYVFGGENKSYKILHPLPCTARLTFRKSPKLSGQLDSNKQLNNLVSSSQIALQSKVSDGELEFIRVSGQIPIPTRYPCGFQLGSSDFILLFGGYSSIGNISQLHLYHVPSHTYFNIIDTITPKIPSLNLSQVLYIGSPSNNTFEICIVAGISNAQVVPNIWNLRLSIVPTKSLTHKRNRLSATLSNRTSCYGTSSISKSSSFTKS